MQPDRMRTYSVLLFDIDGVLVAPFGYREAVRATLRHFFRQMNFPDSLLPDENVIAGFEAIRITSEWDMVPIYLAAVMDCWLSVNPGSILPGQLTEAVQAIGQANSPTRPPTDPGYLQLQQSLRGALKVGEYPAVSVLKMAQSANSTALFPRLAGSPLLESLLAHTRDLNRSATTRIFQHYTLGSQAYQSAYQLSPDIQTSSLLSEFDQPLLPVELARQILKLHSQGIIYPAAYTMRPSLAPRGVDASQEQDFIPEAEIALELVQLSEIPLIGYGKIIYLARQLGLMAESLLKPSPVQAIAAILAAICGDESLALVEGYNVYAKPRYLPDAILQPGNTLNIHVFEDSAGGIEAVLQAARILTAKGIPCSVSAFGIASHPEKIAALKQAGASIQPSTSQAVSLSLQSISAG